MVILIGNSMPDISIVACRNLDKPELDEPETMMYSKMLAEMSLLHLELQNGVHLFFVNIVNLKSYTKYLLKK